MANIDYVLSAPSGGVKKALMLVLVTVTLKFFNIYMYSAINNIVIITTESTFFQQHLQIHVNVLFNRTYQ